jgi:hypothetical protein
VPFELSRLGHTGEIDRVDRVGAERFERPVRLFDLLEPLVRDWTEVQLTAGSGCPHLDDLGGPLVGKRSEQDRIHDAEDRGASPDA